MSPDRLGVVIVCHGSADVICECLETLVAAADHDGVGLHIALVDNASPDGEAALVGAWAARGDGWPTDLGGLNGLGRGPVTKPLTGHALDILQEDVNGGFAAGVNRGVAHLMEAGLSRVWVLNPDTLVPRGTPGVIAAAPEGFGLMGGRIRYAEAPEMIQSDGGWVNARTGVTGGVNLFADAGRAPFPDAGSLDFISGASFVVSRAFWEAVGPMAEDYFLYYEEVDWAWRRGDLPLAADPGMWVYHRAGTSIGSASFARRASPFALYFLHRARHLFMARAHPGQGLLVWAYTLAKIGQLVLRRDLAAAAAIWRGAAGRRPPEAVTARLSPESLARLR